jgi:hypothetical protein
MEQAMKSANALNDVEQLIREAFHLAGELNVDSSHAAQETLEKGREMLGSSLPGVEKTRWNDLLLACQQLLKHITSRQSFSSERGGRTELSLIDMVEKCSKAIDETNKRLKNPVQDKPISEPLQVARIYLELAQKSASADSWRPKFESLLSSPNVPVFPKLHQLELSISTLEGALSPFSGSLTGLPVPVEVGPKTAHPMQMDVPAASQSSWSPFLASPAGSTEKVDVPPPKMPVETPPSSVVIETPERWERWVSLGTSILTILLLTIVVILLIVRGAPDQDIAQELTIIASTTAIPTATRAPSPTSDQDDQLIQPLLSTEVISSTSTPDPTPTPHIEPLELVLYLPGSGELLLSQNQPITITIDSPGWTFEQEQDQLFAVQDTRTLEMQVLLDGKLQTGKFKRTFDYVATWTPAVWQDIDLQPRDEPYDLVVMAVDPSGQLVAKTESAIVWQPVPFDVLLAPQIMGLPLDIYYDLPPITFTLKADSGWVPEISEGVLTATTGDKRWELGVYLDEEKQHGVFSSEMGEEGKIVYIWMPDLTIDPLPPSDSAYSLTLRADFGGIETLRSSTMIFTVNPAPLLVKGVYSGGLVDVLGDEIPTYSQDQPFEVLAESTTTTDGFPSWLIMREEGKRRILRYNTRYGIQRISGEFIDMQQLTPLPTVELS